MALCGIPAPHLCVVIYKRDAMVGWTGHKTGGGRKIGGGGDLPQTSSVTFSASFNLPLKKIDNDTNSILEIAVYFHE